MRVSSTFSFGIQNYNCPMSGSKNQTRSQNRQVVWMVIRYIYEGENRQAYHSVSCNQAISINFTGNFWGGLEYGNQDFCLLDGSVNTWFYAVGAISKYGNGFPGPNEDRTIVELYVICVGKVYNVFLVFNEYVLKILFPRMFPTNQNHKQSWNLPIQYSK